VENDAIVAVELLADPLREFRIAVQARDLVFVLVSHQLRVVARDCFAELRRAGSLLLGVAHSIDEGAIPRGVGRILIVGKKLLAPLDQFIEIARQVLADRNHFGGRRDPAHALGVDGRAPAPQEALQVELDRDAVQLDCTLERSARERNPAFLPGIAEHEHVRGD
jgi:hypothetical protein